MYIPEPQVLKNYADIFVHFGLNGGKGINEGEVVFLRAYESAKPLFTEIRKVITEAGGHVISKYHVSSW